MRIPYGFSLTGTGTLEINENSADVVRRIFAYYLAGASLGKVADMLYAQQIPSPTGKARWTRAAIDHILSNSKYVRIVGLRPFMDAQIEKVDRCNIDYSKEGGARKSTRYVSPAMIQW